MKIKFFVRGPCDNLNILIRIWITIQKGLNLTLTLDLETCHYFPSKV